MRVSRVNPGCLNSGFHWPLRYECKSNSFTRLSWLLYFFYLIIVMNQEDGLLILVFKYPFLLFTNH